MSQEIVPMLRQDVVPASGNQVVSTAPSTKTIMMQSYSVGYLDGLFRGVNLNPQDREDAQRLLTQPVTTGSSDLEDTRRMMEEVVYKAVKGEKMKINIGDSRSGNSRIEEIPDEEGDEVNQGAP